MNLRGRNERKEDAETKVEKRLNGTRIKKENEAK